MLYAIIFCNSWLSMNNPFKNFFKHTDTNVIGIDIGSSVVKIVQVAKVRGRAVLKTYGSIALGPYAGANIGQATNLPAEKISEVLSDLIKEANVTTLNAGVSIPLRSSLVSLIEMPNLPEKDLAQMVPIEARKYIPVPISEVTLDWWIIPKEEEKVFDFEKTSENKPKRLDEKVEALVVSIHNEILNSYNTIVKQAELQTSFFEIEMFASIRSLIDRELDPVMIFDMGAGSTKLYIVERGILKKSHIINKGSQDITSSISSSFQIPFEKAEKIKRNLGSTSESDERTVYEIIDITLDYIFSEANTAFLGFQKKYNKSITKVYLTGGGVAMRGFLKYAKSRFSAEVVIGDPFGKIETPAFLAEILKTTGIDFAVAAGIALRKLQEFE